jgi:hypothetical protein
MKRINWSGIICVLIFSLLACGTALGDEWSVLAFREDFNAGVGEANMPDPNVWVCNVPCNWWWVQSRTFFPSPKYHPNGPFPRVENGICTIENHLYDPNDSGHWTFLGGQIRTKRMFAPNTPYRFEAKVRCKPYPNGIVTSFFLYGYDCANLTNDEVDFEFVSKQTNDDANYPNGDPVMTNAYNESFYKPIYTAPDGLDLTDWNIFRIYWYPNQKQITWTWIDANNQEILLRTETDAFFVADEPMAIYFNFWDPNERWPDAYDANLQPVSDPNANQIYEYEIDYVEARVPQQVCGDVNHLYPGPDQNYDCYLNLIDYSSFSSHWLKAACDRGDCCGAADLNGDCAVNIADLGILVAQWLECTDPDVPCNCNL